MPGSYNCAVIIDLALANARFNKVAAHGGQITPVRSKRGNAVRRLEIARMTLGNPVQKTETSPWTVGQCDLDGGEVHQAQGRGDRLSAKSRCGIPPLSRNCRIARQAGADAL